MKLFYKWMLLGRALAYTFKRISASTQNSATLGTVIAIVHRLRILHQTFVKRVVSWATPFAARFFNCKLTVYCAMLVGSAVDGLNGGGFRPYEIVNCKVALVRLLYLAVMECLSEQRASEILKDPWDYWRKPIKEAGSKLASVQIPRLEVTERSSAQYLGSFIIYYICNHTPGHLKLPNELLESQRV
ncbi:unnamed protein product [Rhizoctonia solani]|uniref:Uncharacterized protein n=1 Tax=Rhizoctonia solani TaxID=456999 RepID=A0A8H3CCV1_9AGAM|nr:unnamed protein product [Rhizoctonia solani]